MRAAVYRRYGAPEEVVGIEEVGAPVPGPGELLVEIRAAAVNPMDSHFIGGRPAIARLGLGLTRPKRTRPGADFAGVVVGVGEGVTRFKPGDAVFGAARGAFAEMACAPERAVALKPDALTFEQAAALPVAGLTALQALRDRGRLAAGQKVLITGAAGGIGSFAVQIAKAEGAEVTAMCSARGLDLVRALGADQVIDREQEDFTRSDARWDVILDLVQDRSFGASRRVLAPGGVLVPAGMLAGGGAHGGWMLRWAGRLALGLLQSRFGRQKLRMVMAKLDADDLATLAELVAAGKVTPVIDRRYSLADTAAAIAYVRAGRAHGKVIVTMEPADDRPRSLP
jgi:NADPH:quinone reductase-like Zn-dependent oxidoreductase